MSTTNVSQRRHTTAELLGLVPARHPAQRAAVGGAPARVATRALASVLRRSAWAAMLVACALITLVVAADAVPVAGDGPATATVAPMAHEWVQVYVEPGDTLWSLATEYGRAADTRDDVLQMMVHNQLTDPQLRVGQRIYVRLVTTK